MWLQETQVAILLQNETQLRASTIWAVKILELFEELLERTSRKIFED